MPVNITDDELDIFNKNGFSDDDVRSTIEDYRSQGLDDNAIRQKIDSRLNEWNTPQEHIKANVTKNYVQNWDKDGNLYYTDEQGNRINDKEPSWFEKYPKKWAVEHFNELKYSPEKRQDLLVDIASLPTFEIGKGTQAALKGTELLKPWVGRKIAQNISEGSIGGGFGSGLIGLTQGYDKTNEHPYMEAIKSGTLGTLIGAPLGGALSGFSGYVGKKIKGEAIKELKGKKNLSPEERKLINKYYSDYKVGRNVVNKNLDLAEPKSDGQDLNNIITNVPENFNPEQLKLDFSDKTDKATRKLEQSVLNAKGTPEEVKEIIKKDLPQYSVMHNNELTKQAVSEVEKNFSNELSRLSTAKEFSALDYEKSRQIAKRLFDAGRHEEAINLIDNVSENATKKGQAIQALSLWSNMTPEGAVYKAAKLINEFNKKVPQRKQIKLTDDNIKQIRELQNSALNATEDIDKTQGFARTVKYISELVPKNIGQKLKSYRNISLLLNPKTLGRNIIGNSLFNALDTVSKTAAVPIDRAIGLVTKNKTRVLPQLDELVKGGLKGAKTGFQEAIEGIDTRGLGQRFDLNSGRTFKNPVMRGVETALDIGLRVPDRTQYEATFAESVANMMKAQGLEKPTQEILEQAEREALESVFQDTSKISEITTNARRALNKLGTQDFGLGDLAIPYAQTPANLVQQAINYSPLGAIKGANNLAQGNQRQASLDLARALIGSGIIGTGYGLSKTGAMTPSQFDENYQKNKTIKANLAPLGIKPETINGFWYAPFQPVSTSLAIGNAMANGENPMQAGLNTMLDLPFLQNVNRGLADIKDKGIAQAGINFASSLPAQFVPTIGSQIAQTIDPYQRETYDPNILKQGLNQAIAKVPVLSQNLPEKIDVTGQPIERYDSEGLQRVFDTYLNPTYINTPKEDAALEELKRLYDETGSTSQFLPIVDKKVNFKDLRGEEVRNELTGKQLSEYQKQVGTINKQLLDSLVGTGLYNNLDDENKIKLINSVQKYAKEYVDEKLFNKPSAQKRAIIKRLLQDEKDKIINEVLRTYRNDVLPVNVKRAYEGNF